MRGYDELVQQLRKPAPPFGMEEYDPTFDVRQEAARAILAMQEQINALDQERDGFANLCADLKADLAGLRSAAKALSDPDCYYDGNNIVIRCESHGDAMKRMRVFRDAIERAPR